MQRSSIRPNHVTKWTLIKYIQSSQYLTELSTSTSNTGKATFRFSRGCYYVADSQDGRSMPADLGQWTLQTLELYKTLLKLFCLIDHIENDVEF